MNDQARKAIGKGMDVNRVLEVVERLRTCGVRLHSSFIVGLPCELASEVYRTNDFLIANRHRYFHSWTFNGLGLAKSSSGESYSLFEKDPESYGIKTFEVPNEHWLNWTNNVGMTRKQANKIAADCNEKSFEYMQFAGWSLAQAWFHNITSDQIINETIESTKVNSIVKKNGNERAELNYSQIVKSLT
jgi:hypothetical protein